MGNSTVAAKGQGALNGTECSLVGSWLRLGTWWAGTSRPAYLGGLEETEAQGRGCVKTIGVGVLYSSLTGGLGSGCKEGLEAMGQCANCALQGMTGSG